jgi:hypothetical protein
MKTLFIGLPCSLAALLLVSFTANPQVTTIGENLYKVHRGTDFTAADVKQISATVAKYYDIPDFNKELSLKWLDGSSDSRGTKAIQKGILVDHTICTSWINEKVVIWQDGASPNPDDVYAMSTILSKYTK